jgi:hypothetical protein
MGQDGILGISWGEAFMSALLPWSCQVLDQGQVLLDV